jgi:hypothetical protein
MHGLKLLRKVWENESISKQTIKIDDRKITSENDNPAFDD